jgi:hypothetical protein
VQLGFQHCSLHGFTHPGRLGEANCSLYKSAVNGLLTAWEAALNLNVVD